jgi:putative oxidoreductase
MFMRKFENHTFALLRIVAGFLFLCHGSQKIFNIPPAGVEIPLYIIVIAGTIELLGGLLILLGLWTRWAAFVAAGEMAYAFWFVHFPRGILPLVNHGEPAVYFCFLFLFFSAHGSGIWSLDSLFKRAPTV